MEQYEGKLTDIVFKLINRLILKFNFHKCKLNINTNYTDFYLQRECNELYLKC